MGELFTRTYMKKLLLFATAGALFGAAFSIVTQASPAVHNDEQGEPGEEDGGLVFPSALVALGVKFLPIINELVKQGVDKVGEAVDHIHQQANAQAADNEQTADNESAATTPSSTAPADAQPEV